MEYRWGKMEYRHKRVCGIVVEKITCEREVVSSNAVTCDFDGISPDYFFYFLILKMVFWKKIAECFLALGKHFAMCPIKNTRQRPSLPMFVRRVQHTAKTLPCVFWPLPLPCAKAHGNQPASRSEGNNDGMECNKSTCENNSPRKTKDEMGFWGIGKVKMMM